MFKPKARTYVWKHQSQSWVAFAQRSVFQSSDSGSYETHIVVIQTVKKSAKVIIERYYPRLTLDFETNKRVCDEIAIIASKRLRNKVLENPSVMQPSDGTIQHKLES